MAKQLGTITKLPSGSYRLRYNKDRKTYSKTVKAANITEAKKILNKMVQTVETQKMLSNNMTFLNLTQMWLDAYLRQNATLKTIESAISVLNLHIIPNLGNKRICDITPLDITSLINKFKQDTNQKGQLISSGTIKKRFSYISSIFSFAYRMELIESNPCLRIKLNLENYKKNDLHFYDLNQTKLFLNQVENENIEYQVIFNLAIYCGMRKSEIYGLQWSDIDLREQTIHIQRTRQRANNETIISKTKTLGSNRTIPINDIIIEKLKQLESKEDFVLTMKTFNNLGRKTHDIQKNANLPQIRFHDLRHTNGTLLLSSGIDIKTVSEFMGHSNIRTTSIYVHAIDQKFKNVSNTLTNILK